MIKLLTIYGYVSMFNCSHITVLNQYTKEAGYDKTNCAVITQIGNKVYTGAFVKSCEEIAKLCDIKEKK